jgi:hypothetical protein
MRGAKDPKTNPILRFIVPFMSKPPLTKHQTKPFEVEDSDASMFL